MHSLPHRDFQFLPIPNCPPDPPSLTVRTSSTWTYCGPLLPLPSSPTSPSTLPPTFHTWSAHTFASPTSNNAPSPSSSPLLPHLLPLLHAIHAFLRARHVHHYWLTIRASLPTPEFDTPRWHTDDHFFAPAQSDAARGVWKLCATLLGPGTLFAAEGDRARKMLRRAKERARTEHVCTTVRCAACGRTADVVREEVAVGLGGREVVQPGRGEMVFFRVGGREGAVHSEPRVGCERVFVNVVPGTEGELRGLMGRWGMEFPRSWSLGVPGAGVVEVLEGKGGKVQRDGNAGIVGV